MTMKKVLKINNYAELAVKIASEFRQVVEDKQDIPNKYILEFQPFISNNPEMLARKAAFDSMGSGFKKVAFDTRRINQETERNPRANLQYWHRSQPFVSDKDAERIEIFAKLLGPVNHIKNKFGTQPEYFDSYARVLTDLVHRTIQVDKTEADIFSPQLDYLEQLLFARYRLSLEDISKIGEVALTERILSKDENLIRRGNFLYSTGKEVDSPIVKNQVVTQEGIIQAIFGNSEFRRKGEKSATRTITITIKDEVD